MKLEARCPGCGGPIDLRRQRPWRHDRTALGLFAVGAALTLAWAGAVVHWSPDDLPFPPRSMGQGAALLAVCLAPGVAVASVAIRRPKVRRVSCRGCGWTDDVRQGERALFEHGSPERDEH
jgi:hypothetical protein